MFATLLQDLKQPEYIHVDQSASGLRFADGLLGLVIAFVMRSRAAQIATLALIVLTGGIKQPGQSLPWASKGTIASSPWQIPMARPG